VGAAKLVCNRRAWATELLAVMKLLCAVQFGFDDGRRGELPNG
jgi:hypothetical protein